ncbi:MAG TPA: hypothetical protein VJH94_01330 [Candidatus Paceibacterota bacterium]
MFNLKDDTLKVLMRNRRHAGEFQYTVPSPDTYPYQWLWDSCFHAIILTRFRVEDAKKELRSLVSKQFENGLIPHVIYWEKHTVVNIDWGVSGTSALTQPPLIAYAAWRIYAQDGDKQFLQELYPHLNRFYRYLLTRDPHGHHLVGIINPDESGEDNSPRFDAALGLPPRHKRPENNAKRFDLFEKNKTCAFDAIHCMREFFWVKDVPMSAYLVENLTHLARIARELGDEENEAYMTGQAHLMSEAMKQHLLEDGIFWSVYGGDYTKIKVKTWAMFAPLVAGIASAEDAKNLVEHHFKNKDEFFCAYPIPTTAKDEEAYSSVEDEGPAWLHPNWRGPVWMASNWFVFRGLIRYGFREEAALIKQKSIELLEKSGFREYFHPDTGEGMGAHDFTWGGLALDMDDKIHLDLSLDDPAIVEKLSA